jgi:hypothetical protein
VEEGFSVARDGQCRAGVDGVSDDLISLDDFVSVDHLRRFDDLVSVDDFFRHDYLGSAAVADRYSPCATGAAHDDTGDTTANDPC